MLGCVHTYTHTHSYIHKSTTAPVCAHTHNVQTHTHTHTYEELVTAQPAEVLQAKTVLVNHTQNRIHNRLYNLDKQSKQVMCLKQYYDKICVTDE